MDRPIRILHVVTHMNRGGLETMIMNYYRNIDKSLIQFDFLTHRPENEKKDYDDEIIALGGVIYHLPKLNPFSISYHRALDDFFEEHPEYSIIHVHQDCLSGIVLKHAKKAGILIRIAHCHSSSQDKNVLYPVKMYYKSKIKKYATKMFACGTAAGKWMFGNNEDFDVLPNAIDVNQYIYSLDIRKTMRLEFNIASDTLVIGHVGRFCNVKNHDFLVDVFADLLKKKRDAVLILVGQGEKQGLIRKKVQNMGIADNVLFLGLRNDVCNILQMMDIFILPSLYEGVPVSIIEAQAAGLKCLVSSCIPIDCKLTNLVLQMKLEDGAKCWSNQILDDYNYCRTNTKKEIVKSHYDIVENAKWLQKFYLDSNVRK